jgi:hypothetical protein
MNRKPRVTISFNLEELTQLLDASGEYAQISPYLLNKIARSLGKLCIESRLYLRGQGGEYNAHLIADNNNH